MEGALRGVTAGVVRGVVTVRARLLGWVRCQVLKQLLCLLLMIPNPSIRFLPRITTDTSHPVDVRTHCADYVVLCARRLVRALDAKALQARASLNESVLIRVLRGQTGSTCC